MYIEEVKKASTADCFEDGMKIRSVEEKFLKLGLCCKTWDSWLDELYLLGKIFYQYFTRGFISIFLPTHDLEQPA